MKRRERKGRISKLTLKQKSASENMEAGPAGLLPSVLLAGVPPGPHAYIRA